MAQQQPTITIKVRSWVEPYVALLVLVAWLAGTTPDEEKLARLITRRGLFVVRC